MYEIIMVTWYQETNKESYEVYKKLGFKFIDDACDYLSLNYKKILDEFPVNGLEIKYNYNRIDEK